MTCYEIAATILGILLTFLFMIYARARRNEAKKRNSQFDFQKQPGSQAESSHAKPDLISQAASGIFKGSEVLNLIMGIIVVGVVLLDAFYDPLTRIVVLSTIGVMLLVFLIWLA